MLKGKIINIEWLIDFNNDDEIDFNQKKLLSILKEIEDAANAGYNCVVLIMLIDGFLIQDPLTFHPMIDFINLESKKLGIQEVIILSGHGETFSGLKNKHYFLDYTLRMTYNAYKYDLDVGIKKTPNNKFLFLGGVSTRPNRIGLLKKLYDNNLLENSVWSFFSPTTESDKIWCRNYCKDYTDDQYNKFIFDCERSVDNVYEDCKEYFGDYSHDADPIEWCKIVEKDFMKNPAYIDAKVFNNTSFSIISEGINYWDYSTDFSFVTEKFWRTVILRHPFIFAGYVDQYLYIKRLGFRTFDQYMLYPEYAVVDDEEKRLDLIVKNTKHFLEIWNENKNKIRDDVEYNFRLARTYIEKQNQLLIHLQTHYGVSKDDIKHYIDRSGYDHLIRGVKDAVI